MTSESAVDEIRHCRDCGRVILGGNYCGTCRTRARRKRLEENQHHYTVAEIGAALNKTRETEELRAALIRTPEPQGCYAIVWDFAANAWTPCPEDGAEFIVGGLWLCGRHQVAVTKKITDAVVELAKQKVIPPWMTNEEAVSVVQGWLPSFMSERPKSERHLYVARSRLNPNLIKIGVSTNPTQRVADLKCDLIAVVENGGASEGETHERFAEHRAEGEYFRYEGALIEWVESLTTEVVTQE